MAAALTVQSSGFFPDYSKDQESVPLPVIHHVITDKELHTKVHQPTPPEINLEKLLKLLTNKHSKSLIERHYRAIKLLCSCYKNGIHLKDVKLVLEVLKKCHEYLNIDTGYEESVCSILNLLSKPFLKSKVSEEITFLPTVSQCMTELGLAAEDSSDNIKCTTAEAISKLYTTPSRNREPVHDPQPVSTKFIKECISKSEICKSLAECLGQASDNSTRYILLKALSALSDSKLTCDGMLLVGGASNICLHLSQDVNDYKLLFLGVETLWNILEYGSVEQIQNQLSNLECLLALKHTFLTHIWQCHSHADRQLRNDIFVIITLVISKCPDAPLLESGLVHVIASYASYPEVPTRDQSMQLLKFSKHPEDFELKKLFFNAINILCVHPEAKTMVKALKRSQVMLALYSYVIPIKEPMPKEWSLSEFEELQLHAMAVLAVYASIALEDHVELQGNARVLAMLDWCVNAEEFGGHGNSFYGAGGRGSKRAQMRYCIRLLRSICNTGDEEILQDLTDQGIISQLVAILSACSSSTDINDAVDIELQCDMLFILAILCESDIHRKELFGESGVKMMAQFMTKYFTVTKGPVENHKLVLSTVDCIWSTVIGCYLNEICLLEKEGAFLLLDLLETCPEKMQNVVMGIIVDLMENKNTLKHLGIWRGDENKTIGKLLVDLWTGEEKRLNVQRDDKGVVTDFVNPLKTNFQSLHEYIIVPMHFASPAIVDIPDNLRAKIYSLFSKIGFQNVEGLQAKDYIVVSIIEHYLDFKTLEVWQEIRDELTKEQIEPVSTDKECISTIIHILQHKAKEVARKQTALIDHHGDLEVLEELDFYSKIKESYKQEEKRYQDFVHFVERTSNHAALKNARRIQLEHIQQSRTFHGSDKDLEDRFKNLEERKIQHETLDPKLQTTVFCGRNVIVQSTKMEDPVVKELERSMLPKVFDDTESSSGAEILEL
ncbi:cilia- and flagella-associated protein 69-like isoform X1 [Clytia hemisphaerica]|uniref:Cilia- and flagella-associated protein 69 ARM repeats domain-containing protein n=2 Tax=Clytia hemisphaerica TaxID=252671 RepID=A0A7M6DLW3_9CNID